MLSDADLLDIAMDFRAAIVGAGSSARRCGMVCWPLEGYLRFLGQLVETQETVVGDTTHVWLLLPDGRVLDPTADQFDTTLPPVYLGPKLVMHTGAVVLAREER
jgi:hypothetical protein